MDACETIRAQPPKLSKIESGKQFPTPDEVRTLAEFYGASYDEREYLVRLAEQKPKRRRRTGQRDAVPDWFRRYVALEWDATEIKSCQVELIHGLLQTEDHARSAILTWEPEADSRLVDKAVVNRMKRRPVFQRTGRPSVRFEVLLSEAALHRIEGSKAITRAQLKHLVKMSKRPNITIRVLPFDKPNRIALPSSISLLKLAQQNLAAVYLEDLFGATYLKEPEEYTQYNMLFARLRDAAFDVDESRALLDKMAGTYA